MNPVVATSIVSSALGHDHSLPQWQLRALGKSPTSRALQDAWIAEGAQRWAWLEDDSVPQSRKSLFRGATGPGIIGWAESATDDIDWPELRHTTGSGRLSFALSQDGLTVEVTAGPAQRVTWLEPGRLILTVIIRESGVTVEWSDEGYALIAEKPHRLIELVQYVDRPLGGIVSAADPVLAGYVAIRPRHVAEPTIQSLPEDATQDQVDSWWICRDKLWKEHNTAREAAAEEYAAAIGRWVEEEVKPLVHPYDDLAGLFGPTRQERRETRCRREQRQYYTAPRFA